MEAVAAYFGNIQRTLVSVFEGMAVTMSWMFRKPITIQYPHHPSAPRTKVGGPDTLPARYRGFLEVDTGVCTACLACERACPIACIAITVDKVVMPGDAEQKPVRAVTRFDIDMGKCMYCGLCSEPCPTGSIRHTQQFESAVAHVENLVFRFVTPGKPFLPYKIKKDEAAPETPRGSIAEGIVAARPWDL